MFRFNLRPWQEYYSYLYKGELKVHDHIENFEIIDPPPFGEDQELNHGGQDVCMDVEEAPAREEAVSNKHKDEEIDRFLEELLNNDDKEKDYENYEEEHNRDYEDYENEENKNNEEVINLKLYELRKRRLKTTLAILFAKVAEDLSGWPTEGDDEWSPEAILERTVTKRSLYKCRQSFEREKLILILDTSGSCQEQAQFYAEIAALAAKLGCVEIYTAPNAWLEKVYNPKTKSWDNLPEEKQGSWPFKNKTIIFFGDFDGGDEIIKASWKNKVFWFSCENRYEDMDEHSWCSYTLQDFKGKYFECHHWRDFVKFVKKIKA